MPEKAGPATVPTSLDSDASRYAEMYQRYSTVPTRPLCPRKRPSGKPHSGVAAWRDELVERDRSAADALHHPTRSGRPVARRARRTQVQLGPEDIRSGRPELAGNLGPGPWKPVIEAPKTSGGKEAGGVVNDGAHPDEAVIGGQHGIHPVDELIPLDKLGCMHDGPEDGPRGKPGTTKAALATVERGSGRARPMASEPDPPCPHCDETPVKQARHWPHGVIAPTITRSPFR